jgi:hypothetical protein
VSRMMASSDALFNGFGGAGGRWGLLQGLSEAPHAELSGSPQPEPTGAPPQGPSFPHTAEMAGPVFDVSWTGGPPSGLLLEMSAS